MSYSQEWIHRLWAEQGNDYTLLSKHELEKREGELVQKIAAWKAAGTENSYTRGLTLAKDTTNTASLEATTLVA